MLPRIPATGAAGGPDLPESKAGVQPGPFRVDTSTRKRRATEVPQPQGSQPRPAAVEPPDLAVVARLTRERPPLRHPGVRAIEPGDVPHACVIHHDVGMDCRVRTLVVRQPGDTLATSGVASCYALGAMGRNRNGETVLALGHFSMIFATEDPDATDEVLSAMAAQSAIEEVDDAMAQAGVLGARYFVAGGAVCLWMDSAGRRPEDALSSLDAGVKLIDACGQRLIAARIGLSRAGADREAPPGATVVADTRPDAVTVLLNASGMLYCTDGARGTRVPRMPAMDEDLYDDDDVEEGPGEASELLGGVADHEDDKGPPL